MKITHFLCYRFSECITLVSLSTTFFLFLHSRDLNLQLSEEKLRHQDDHDVVQENDEHFHSRDLSTAAGDDSEDYSQVEIIKRSGKWRKDSIHSILNRTMKQRYEIKTRSKIFTMKMGVLAKRKLINEIICKIRWGYGSEIIM